MIPQDHHQRQDSVLFLQPIFCVNVQYLSVVSMYPLHVSHRGSQESCVMTVTFTYLLVHHHPY